MTSLSAPSIHGSIAFPVHPAHRHGVTVLRSAPRYRRYKQFFYVKHVSVLHDPELSRLLHDPGSARKHSSWSRR